MVQLSDETSIERLDKILTRSQAIDPPPAAAYPSLDSARMYVFTSE